MLMLPEPWASHNSLYPTTCPRPGTNFFPEASLAQMWQQLTESLPYCLAVLTLSLGPSDHHIAKPVVIWMDGWMNGWLGGWMNGLMACWMDGFLDGWKVNCWMGGWMDRWMGGRMDYWMDGLLGGRMDEWIWRVASHCWGITGWKSWA